MQFIQIQLIETNEGLTDIIERLHNEKDKADQELETFLYLNNEYLNVLFVTVGF